MIADAPTLALHLSSKDGQQLVEDEPRWLRHFAAWLAERDATAWQAHTEAQGLRGDDWVLARLRLVAQVEQAHGAESAPVRPSQARLGRMVSVSRPTLNTSLTRLQRRGLPRVAFRLIGFVE